MAVPEHVVAGLPASAKTLACEVVQKMGWDFTYGKEGGKVHPGPILESPHMRNLCATIAAPFAPSPRTWQWARYDPAKHEGGVFNARQYMPRTDKLSSAFKCHAPGIMPLLIEVFPFKSVLWCHRDFEPWKGYLEGMGYPMRGVDFKAAWDGQQEDLDQLLASHKRQAAPGTDSLAIVVFNVDRMTAVDYHRSTNPTCNSTFNAAIFNMALYQHLDMLKTASMVG